MFALGFRTAEFSTDPEGDLIHCNGRPGSAVARWLRSVLVEKGIDAGEPLQEDYGWGFWLSGPLSVWVAVGLVDGEPGDVPVWNVSVAHEVPLLSLRQWLRRRRGREMARRVFDIVREALARRSGVVIEE